MPLIRHFRGTYCLEVQICWADKSTCHVPEKSAHCQLRSSVQARARISLINSHPTLPISARSLPPHFLNSDGAQREMAMNRPGFRRDMIRLPSPRLLLLLPILLLLIVDPVPVRAESASAFVQNAIYSNRIAIFSKSYCP